MIRRIPIPTAVSLLAIALAAIVILLQLPALFVAIVGSGADGEDPRNEIARILEQHEEYQMLDRDRFNGRSLFYRPPPPRRERPRPPRSTRPEPPTVEPPKPVDPGPPPPPATYQGPSINFTVGSDVWFMPARTGEKGFRVRVGEELEGIRVIAITPPWSVKLGYRGGEYDVDLLERKSDQFFGTARKETPDHSSMIRVADPADTTAVANATGAAAAAPDAGEEKPPPPGRNPLRSTFRRPATAAGGGSRSVKLASKASGEIEKKSEGDEKGEEGGTAAPVKQLVVAPGRPAPAPPTPSSEPEPGSEQQAPWREVGGDEEEADREKTGEGEEEGEADNAEPTNEEDGEDGDPPS